MSEQALRPPQPLYKIIATTVDAYHRCCKKGNHQWEGKHLERLEAINDLLPSGSGIDSGTEIDIEASTGETIMLSLSYHHMNSDGVYDGWTEYRVRVKASMIHGTELKISGRDRNDTKDYLYATYIHALDEKYDVATMKVVREEPFPITKWEDDLLQFARLIEELQGQGGFTDEIIDALCISMDLEPARIVELMARAQKRWDNAKARV